MTDPEPVPRSEATTGRAAGNAFPLATLVATSDEVAATRSRKRKAALLSECLSAVPRSELPLAIAWLSGQLRQGRIGVGPAALRSARPEGAAEASTLTLGAVDRVFDTIAAVSGKGSGARRKGLLFDLLGRATEAEQRFLVALLHGELRQGALLGVMTEAVAATLDVAAKRLRRAVLFTGDLPAVARVAVDEGVDALDAFELEIGRPLDPMLASAADDAAEVLDRHGEAAFEYKLDGARIQVHKNGDSVAVFTRQLHDVTAAVPEVVSMVASLPASRLVLDGEVLALDAAGRPRPFQTTMRRFGRKLDVAALARELPLTPFFFDCLHRDGDTLIDAPQRERLDVLSAAVPSPARIPYVVTGDAAEAEAFFARARAEGHEGLMAKALDAPYDAGRRGSGWMKLKFTHTLDLVVLAVEWGSGRRTGKLSNLHLGARDPVTGGFVMLGKTFKGITDEVLVWQTRELLARETRREDHVVHVRPELVVEIAFNDVQRSPRYPAGLALRFARLVRYRNDKTPADADTIATVRAIHEGAAPTS